MAEEIRKVVVDTYAIIADLTGQAPSGVTEVLEKVRKGTIKGMLHYLIVYELAYHWKRGRLPFRDEEELLEFINRYFTITVLDLNIALKASNVKLIGDKLLRASKDPSLKRRKLSVADATTIAIAVSSGAPIVTGDTDLSYVARKLGATVIW
ncbi:MAG: PIN domain-containing protein [Desulfurococcales archaeon]|nr:PIN domain-containing protein [Desulfurococcales archaeon]